MTNIQHDIFRQIFKEFQESSSKAKYVNQPWLKQVLSNEGHGKRFKTVKLFCVHDLKQHSHFE